MDIENPLVQLQCIYNNAKRKRFLLNFDTSKRYGICIITLLDIFFFFVKKREQIQQGNIYRTNTIFNFRVDVKMETK